MQKLVTTLSCLLLLCLLYWQCKPGASEATTGASLILHNAHVYPVTGAPVDNGAVAIRDGKIIAVGTSADILSLWKQDSTQLIDCRGQFLMPGFIEGHGHFESLGESLVTLNLLESKSWDAIVDSVAARVKLTKPGEWIFGRGWHQEKWNAPVTPAFNGYPYHDAISAISPDNPVILEHASGHSMFANAAAMRLAGITAETPNPDGGLILRDKQGKAIGIFEENAAEVFEDLYEAYELSMTAEEQDRRWNQKMAAVQQHCLEHGITTFEDAGSTFEEVKRYQQMAIDDKLELRLYAMLYEKLDSLQGHLEGFPILQAGDDMFTCRAVKTYLDGALGSYGAWLLEPYNDRPGFSGQITTTLDEVKGLAELCMEHDMQLAVHAIGDQGNRKVLDIMEETMKAHPDKTDRRWRIEHAQHIDPADIPRFKSLGVIASMQAIHCTSDSPFVVKRLGEERARTGAYPWRSLLDSGAVLANGTDAPVEHVDPIPNFYASVTRKRLDDGTAFFPEQAMTRQEALYSLTMANAYAAFEENVKGSIEAGKYADLVLLDQNLITCAEDEIAKTKVVMTMVNGEIRYGITNNE